MTEGNLIAGVPEFVVKVRASVVNKKGDRCFTVRLRSKGQPEVTVASACYDDKRGRWWGKLDDKSICYWRAQPPAGVKVGRRILSWLPA